MANPTYVVEVLDRQLQPITRLQNFVPLSDSGNVIEYATRLSNSGTARFRVPTIDPVLTRYGDILKPWVNQIRIYRNDTLEWQGFVQDVPGRNKRYIEVKACSYLEEFKKVLVRHDPVTQEGEDTRTFKSGTMADAITAIVTEAKASGTGRIIQGLTTGTIENPVYPQGFVNLSNSSIGGQPWTFNNDFMLKFDFKSTLEVLSTLAGYSQYEFELTHDLVFNFKKRFGVDKPEIMFEFSDYGSIEDFEAPLDGKNQANHLVGIAADIENNILKLDPMDQLNIAINGKLDGVAAFADVKNRNVLGTRLNEELRLNSAADTELRVILNERAVPYGTYELGDVCSFKIQYGAISVNETREIIGIQVNVHNTGRERIILQTNKPRTT